MKVQVTIYDKGIRHQEDRKIVFDEIFDNCEELHTSKGIVSITARNNEGLDMIINIPIIGEFDFNARLIE